MCTILYHPIVLVVLFFHCAEQQKCDPSLCNHEGSCTLTNDKPTCKCLEQFFTGDLCEIPTDHCSNNPCHNGGTCHHMPGHYYCECSKGFSGQNCSSNKKSIENLHLHYNHVVPAGTVQTMILMVQSLGSVETILEFYSPHYIIDGIAFTPSSGHFEESSDLIMLGNRLGLKHSDSLAYKTGFYKLCNASFWNPGTHTMSLQLSDFGPSAEVFFSGTFDISVYFPPEVKCSPSIHLPHCLNPRKPLHLDIATFDFIEPVVIDRCMKNSTFKIKWSVRNYIDTVVLHKFPEQSSKTLMIVPYTMWFNYRDDYVQSYLIQGDVSEINSKGNQISKTVLRCYVFVDSKPTDANILGGSAREVGFDQQLTIDGSISRDYARRPTRDQKLQYLWSCESEDSGNSNCLSNMGSAPRLSIPPRALRLNETYKFSLQVRSSINIYSTSRTSQIIKVVSGDPLLIHFVCVQNCEHNKFATGKAIHLKLECVQCPPGEIAYSVSNRLGILVAETTRFSFLDDSREEVFFKAEASLGTLKGGTSITLTLNKPPSKGSCTILPASGVEFETIFKISCLGYEDEDMPIDYKFWAGTRVLDHSGDEILSTRLFVTSGQICEIKISICDDIGACTEVQLEVSLTQIAADGSWLSFLFQKESNFKALIQNGDRSSAMSLIYTVIQHVPPSETLEVARHLVTTLRELKLVQLLTTEQILTVGNELFEVIPLSSESALLVSELFEKTAKGMMHSIETQEIHELNIETHELMETKLLKAMAKTSAEIEKFPMVHVAEPIPPEDPFSENYSDYGELDIEDVVHMSNWLESFNRMHRCLQIFGVASAFTQLPGEVLKVTKKNGITSKTLLVDKTEAVSLSWSETNTFVDFNSEFLKTFPEQEIAVQTTIFESNPLWWYPEQHKIKTDVLSIGIYSRNLSSLKPKSTRVAFSYSMTLKGDLEDIITHKGTVNELEMVVFERSLPAKAVLVVTFLPLDEDIRVLLKVGEKPRSFMLRDAKAVKRTQENTTLLLINHKSRELKAYMAIAPEARTNFAFQLLVRMCVTWNQQEYKWTSEYCTVGNRTNTTHIHCSCNHLSMFAAKIHPTFGQVQPSKTILNTLDINYGMMVLFLALPVFLGLLLWRAWLKDLKAMESLIAVDERKAANRYVVTIYTNGQSHAGTTSNISIQLHGTLCHSERYTLYSEPGQSVFQRNSQVSFVVQTGNDLGLLEFVSLQHDGLGRYPTWNCHMVKVRDERAQLECIFMVNQWISDEKQTYVPLLKIENIQTKWQIFNDTLADTFANWHAQQAVASARLYGCLSAVEKTAVFIFRCCLTVMGTIYAFGPTTIYTYETERETYYSMLLDAKRLFVISCFCYIFVVIGTEALKFLFMKISTNTTQL